MCHAGGVDEVTWGALTLTLTAVGAVWTWFAFRRRGLAAGLRGAAFTLLPPAAFLTGTLEMFTEIGGSVADWATHLVLSPVVWLGVILAGVSGVLFVVSGVLRSRQLGSAEPTDELKAPGRKELKAPGRRSQPPVDDEMAEIEAILRKRGIT
jgi:hypothetical protein